MENTRDSFVRHPPVCRPRRNVCRGTRASAVTGAVLVLSGHKGSELAGTEQQLGLPLSNQCVPPAATESWMATLALGGEAARREGVCLTGRFVSLPSPQLFLLCGPWGGRGEGRSGGICSC